MSVSLRGSRLLGSALFVTAVSSVGRDDERPRPRIRHVEGAGAGRYWATMTSWQLTDDAAMPPGGVS
jgi:hypothetical protein